MFGVFETCSLVNHSCKPNCYFVFVDNQRKEDSGSNRDKKLQLKLVENRPITERDELFVNYVPQKKQFQERQDALAQQWGFTCQCESCLKQE